MLRFNAAYVAFAVGAIQGAIQKLSSANDDTANQKIVRDALADVKSSLDELPLSHVVRAQFDRLTRRLDNTSCLELIILVGELNNNLLMDLMSAYFLMITSDKREYYEQCLPHLVNPLHEYFRKPSMI